MLQLNFDNPVIFAAAICFAIVPFASCGKRRPPAPPVSNNSRLSLTARQSGNEILLALNIPRSIKQDIKQINLYRLNETADASAFLSEADFSARATQIAAIVAAPNQAPPDSYRDALSNNKQALKLRYSAVIVFADNRRSGFSNFAIVQPFFKIAAAPPAVVYAVGQRAIRLEWQKPAAALDGSAVTNLLGYNLYRATIENEIAAPARLLNQTLLADAFFEDRAFEFGKTYSYFVRAVSLAENGQPIESNDSNRVSVTPRDRFAPAAPNGLTVAAAPNRLSLFFAASADDDVVGYNVYRSVNETEPVENWRLLNQTPVNTTTYQDLQIENNRKYFYYVRAVDSAGNLSEPSEIVSETAL